MGLDMYLEADVSICEYEKSPQATALREAVKQNFEGLYNPNNSFIGGKVTIPLAYWRKSNQIHAWFVKNVQEGVDECERSYVEREKLEALLAACKQVQANHSHADEILPTREGFFFGDTSYSEYYYGDIDRTVKMLERILEHLPKDADVYYHSSW